MSDSTNRLFREAARVGASKGLLADIARDLFHDFNSPLVAPKMELARRLREEALTDLAERVKAGEFDER